MHSQNAQSKFKVEAYVTSASTGPFIVTVQNSKYAALRHHSEKVDLSENVKIAIGFL